MLLRKEDDVSGLLKVWRLPRKTMKSIQRTVLFANKEPFFANQVFELFQVGLEEGIQAAKVRAAMKGENVSEAEAIRWGISIRIWLLKISQS